MLNYGIDGVVFPELRELMNIAYSGRMHGGVDMLQHSINALSSLRVIETASRLVDGTGITNYSRFTRLFELYKKAIPGLEGLAEAEFLEIVTVYKKALTIQLRTQGREKDIKLFLYLAIVLHDIGKTICVTQHYTIGKVMARRVFERMGFDPADAELAGFLVSNHSLYHRLLTGSDSYEGFSIGVGKVKGNNPEEAIHAATAMMCLADDGGISQEGFLTSGRAKSIINMVTKPGINFVDRDEPRGRDYNNQVMRLSRHLNYKQNKKEVLAKLNDIKPLLSEIYIRDPGFEAFLDQASFFYTRFAVLYMDAQALVNFYYLAYKYAKTCGITEQPWIYLASENKITPEQAQILNAALSKVKLWEEDASAEELARRFNIGLERAFENPNQKIIMRVNIAQPKEPQAGLDRAESKYKSDTYKTYGNPFRRMLEKEIKALDRKSVV